MNYILGILLFFLPLSVLAQSEGTGFTADRPGATTEPDVIPKGRLQWETGVGYQHIKMEGLETYSWTLNTTLLRFGISDYAELRLQGDWNKTGGDIHKYRFGRAKVFLECVCRRRLANNKEVKQGKN